MSKFFTGSDFVFWKRNIGCFIFSRTSGVVMKAILFSLLFFWSDGKVFANGGKSEFLKTTETLMDTTMNIGDFILEKKVLLSTTVDTGNIYFYFDSVGMRTTTYNINPPGIRFISEESIYSIWNFFGLNEMFKVNDTLIGILQSEIIGGGTQGMCGGVVYYDIYLVLAWGNDTNRIHLISTNGCRGDVIICGEKIVSNWVWEDEYGYEIDGIRWAEQGKKLIIEWYSQDETPGQQSLLEILPFDKKGCRLTK